MTRISTSTLRILVLLIDMPWSRDKKRIKENYKKVIEYKKKIRCDHCGVRDHRVIDFHHIRDKEGEVSQMVYQGYGWNRIKEEIDRCVPLCSNCHRIHHWKGGNDECETELESA